MKKEERVRLKRLEKLIRDRYRFLSDFGDYSLQKFVDVCIKNKNNGEFDYWESVKEWSEEHFSRPVDKQFIKNLEWKP